MLVVGNPVATMQFMMTTMAMNILPGPAHSVDHLRPMINAVLYIIQATGPVALVAPLQASIKTVKTTAHLCTELTQGVALAVEALDRLRPVIAHLANRTLTQVQHLSHLDHAALRTNPYRDAAACRMTLNAEFLTTGGVQVQPSAMSPLNERAFSLDSVVKRPQQ